MSRRIMRHRVPAARPELRCGRLVAIAAAVLAVLVTSGIARAGPPPWAEDRVIGILRAGIGRDVNRKSTDFNIGLGAAGVLRLNSALRAGFDVGYLDLPDRLIVRDSVEWDSTVTVTILGIDRERNQTFFGAAVVHLVWPGARLGPYALASFGMYALKYREIEETRPGVSLGIGLQPDDRRSFGTELRWHRAGLRPGGVSLVTLMVAFKFP